MAYCGAKRVADGSVCSDGSMSTVLPNGRGGPSRAAQQEATTDTVTGDVAWNSDTTPVQAGRRPAEYSDYIPGGRRQTTEANMSTVAAQRETFNELRGKGTVKGASKEDRQQWQNMLGALRQYTGSELGTRGAQEQAWADVLKDASRAGVDVYELLSGGSSDGSGDGLRRGGSGSSGPRTTTSASVTDATTAEALLNKVATDLIGRNLTANEIKKYTQQFNALEQKNPAVSVSDGAGSSVTTSAPDKAELLRQVVSKNPDYMKFQVDTTVMDMFLDRIKEGQAVANG